ncbi:hypothetical protein EGW08_016596 [Elysia chlorotica]|uniref:Uncharacterized protein n=1 Tax=Elysia chlorotica TaxID=188477 RepID=A0A3S0ZEC0_ELYCH|nr:hypothetical protein EGW08_016596 [Elysia chlorotica]
MSRFVSSPALLISAVLVILGLCLAGVDGTRGRGHSRLQPASDEDLYSSEEGDEADEADEGDEGGECSEEEYRCEGPGVQCIPRGWMCDNDFDCAEQDDERNCAEPHVCSNDEFRCRSGGCIPSSWRCDDDPDCADSSDEAACHPGLQVNHDEDHGSRVARSIRKKKARQLRTQG